VLGVELIATRCVTVVNPQGFHARPAHLFVKLAGQFQATVEILKGNEVINGKSILDLLTLGAGNGTTLTLRASGPDTESAVAALATLVEGGFGEAEPAQEQA
jgi:phosphocarrier protein HPr